MDLRKDNLTSTFCVALEQLYGKQTKTRYGPELDFWTWKKHGSDNLSKLHEDPLIMLDTSTKHHKCTKVIVMTINMGAHMRRVVVAVEAICITQEAAATSNKRKLFKSF